MLRPAVRFACDLLRRNAAVLFIAVWFFPFHVHAEEGVARSAFKISGCTFDFPGKAFVNEGYRSVDDGSEIALDILYPGGGFVEEFNLALRDGKSVRLFVAAHGTEPGVALDNILRYRAPAQQPAEPQARYVKYRVTGGATVDYYYFSNLPVFASCLVDSGVDVVGNPMCRARFGQIFPDVFASAIFAEKLLSEIDAVTVFVENFLLSHIRNVPCDGASVDSLR